MRLSLTLLGDLQTRIGSGAPVRLRTRKTQALLAYLAMPAGVPHSRDKLATLLWGDRSLTQARSRFRETLFALRRALAAADPPCLTVTGETVALDADAVDVDAGAFVRLARTGDSDSLSRAVDLYRGEFLEGLAFRGTLFEDWLMAERERLRELALEALARLLAQQRRAGAAAPALRTALRLITLDPLQESVHRTLMRLYAELGRRGSALQQYQVCVGILLAELGVEPEEETRQLYQDILRRPRPARSPDPSEGEHELGGPHPAAEPLASDGPLVGREPEMARLKPVVGGGRSRGSAIVLVGEAGVGKTRLVGELAVEARATGRRVLSGRCYESEQILPFAPWLAILRAAWAQAGAARLAGLPLPMRRELDRLLPELWPADGDTAPAANYLVLFEGVSRLLEQAADADPTVVILEDLHWADEMSLRLLAFIGRRLAAWRLVVIATAREEDLADAPMLQRTFAELAREPHVDTVALRSLSRESTAALVRALAPAGADDVAVARLSDDVWRTSGGSPLVVVEAMRTAAHETLSPDLAMLSLPERVRDIIRGQLERLAAPSRDLVALASVVGREFEFGLLLRVSGLGEEVAARGVEELIRRRVLHSVDERLDFRHDRVREVAYGEILGPRRKALHRRVAEALEIVHAGDLEPHHLALGLHAFEGEMWGKAVLHLRRAGATALDRFAKREAVACFARALAALERLPRDHVTLEQGFDIRLELRPALNQLGENRRVLECLREADALAEQLNDDRRRGRVRAFMSVARSLVGELDEALADGARAREIAERVGDLRLRLLATDILEQSHYLRGDYERVVELATDNLAVLPADWAAESFGRFAPTSVYDRVFLARSLAELGRFDEAARYALEGIQLAEPTQHAYAIGMAHWTAGWLLLVRGDWALARPRIDHGIAALRTADAVLALPWAVAAGAWVLAQLGEEDEGLSRLREGEQLVQDLAARQVTGNTIRAYHALGRGYLLLGRPDDARRLSGRALDCSPIWPGDLAHALHLRAEVAADPKALDPASGEADYQRALTLAKSRGMRPLAAHCHFGLGRLHRSMNRRAAADEHLAAAAAMYRDMAMSFWLERAEARTQAYSPTPVRH